MTEQLTPVSTCTHGLQRDPQPFTQSGMAASCQTTWWKAKQFEPRREFCQDADCYYDTDGKRIV